MSGLCLPFECPVCGWCPCQPWVAGESSPSERPWNHTKRRCPWANTQYTTQNNHRQKMSNAFCYKHLDTLIWQLMSPPCIADSQQEFVLVKPARSSQWRWLVEKVFVFLASNWVMPNRVRVSYSIDLREAVKPRINNHRQTKKNDLLTNNVVCHVTGIWLDLTLAFDIYAGPNRTKALDQLPYINHTLKSLGVLVSFGGPNLSWGQMVEVRVARSSSGIKSFCIGTSCIFDRSVTGTCFSFSSGSSKRAEDRHKHTT